MCLATMHFCAPAAVSTAQCRAQSTSACRPDSIIMFRALLQAIPARLALTFQHAPQFWLGPAPIIFTASGVAAAFAYLAMPVARDGTEILHIWLQAGPDDARPALPHHRAGNHSLTTHCLRVCAPWDRSANCACVETRPVTAHTICVNAITVLDGHAGVLLVGGRPCGGQGGARQQPVARGFGEHGPGAHVLLRGAACSGAATVQ